MSEYRLAMQAGGKTFSRDERPGSMVTLSEQARCPAIGRNLLKFDMYLKPPFCASAVPEITKRHRKLRNRNRSQNTLNGE
jgi:hypothetical protein